jgi:flavin reductase (DIM6/NTAB) family NADH-FMN oxidoreductase RutF
MSPVALCERPPAMQPRLAAAPHLTVASRAADRDVFVAAMARALTGVWILATDSPEGRVALTVSAVSSVSADPPMVLACVNSRHRVRNAVLASGHFALSLLTDDQADLADVFAGRPAAGMPHDFDRAEWRTDVTGAPLLVRAAAGFDCVLSSSVEAGTHTILIGSVVSALRATGSPLGYTDRAYARTTPLGS